MHAQEFASVLMYDDVEHLWFRVCSVFMCMPEFVQVEVDTLGEFGTTALFDACYFDNRCVVWVCVGGWMCVCIMHIYTHTVIYESMNMWEHRCVYMRVQTRTDIPSCYTRTHTHTHAHTCIHTYEVAFM